MKTPTIMVPLDGSPFAESAVPVAVGLAEKLGGRIRLVSAIYELELIAVEKQPVYTSPPAMTEVDIERQTDEYLDTLIDRLEAFTEVPVSKTIEHGPIAPTLEEYAENHALDLIVMSTHGRGALSRFWIGSVADHVVRHVKVPTLLVRPKEGEDVALNQWTPFESIVVALDGSDRAETSIELATDFARAMGSRVVLLRTVPPPFPVQSPYLPDAAAAMKQAMDAGEEEAERYLAEIADDLKREGVDVETVVVVGKPATTGILEFVQTTGASLVAIATHGRGGVSRAVLGSVADKVVRGAEVPVLLSRPTEL